MVANPLPALSERQFYTFDELRRLGIVPNRPTLGRWQLKRHALDDWAQDLGRITQLQRAA